MLTFSCEYAWKSLPAFSGAMPMPVSRTAKRMSADVGSGRSSSADTVI